MSSVPYIPLSSNNHKHTGIIDCSGKSQQTVKRIHWVIRNKNAKHNIKQRYRTFHEFSLSEILLRELREDGEFNKIVANIRQFKALRCLNIDLEWLTICYQRHSLHKFAQSLKHLKSLSTLYFYTSKPYSERFNSEIPSLPQLLGKVIDLSKIDIHLSYVITFGLGPGDLKLLKGFSQLQSFTSVHITFQVIDLQHIPEVFAPIKDCKSLRKLSISVLGCHCFSDFKLEDLFRSLKEMRFVKFMQIYIRGFDIITRPQLKKIAPIIRDIAKTTHLKMTFGALQVKEANISKLDIFLLNRSIKNGSTSDKVHTKFIGFTPIIPFVWSGILLALLSLMSMVKIPGCIFFGFSIALAILIWAIIIQGCMAYFEDSNKTEKSEAGKFLLKQELENLSSKK